MSAPPPAAATPALASATPAPGLADHVDRRGISTLLTGHGCVDMCQGAVPALLPFFISHRGYSYGAASALVLAVTVSSSIIQPIFGIASDRRSVPWLMPLGLVLAGIGIALSGVVESYALTFAAITLSGIGVAAYHPEGSRYANYVSGARRASGMSLFSIGGNAGFALGPLLATGLVLAFGTAGTVGLLLPPLLAAVILTRELPRLRGFRTRVGAIHAAQAGTDHWGPFWRLGAAVAARSVFYFGLLTFVPLYFADELGTAKADGNAALTAMLICGAIGTFVGGRIADRVGAKAVFVWSMVLVTPLVVAFLFAGPLLATVLLALIGALTIATFSVTVVIGQALIPNHVGIASGVTLGLSIGIGGVGATLLGLVADSHGVRLPLEIVAVIPLVTLALALTMPTHAGSARRRSGVTGHDSDTAAEPAG